MCVGLVLGTGIEPVHPKGERFSSHYGFHRQPVAVRALDYALAVACALGPRRLVSTPSPFGAWLGIASPLGQGVRRI